MHLSTMLSEFRFRKNIGLNLANNKCKGHRFTITLLKSVDYWRHAFPSANVIEIWYYLSFVEPLH